jgi:electron transfer flavoprotein alpha subunit
MAILIFTESAEGAIKKSSLEAISYGAELAKQLNTTVTAIAFGAVDNGKLESLGNQGAKKVLSVEDSKLEGNIQAIASIVAQAMEKENADVLILSKSSLGDAVAARVSAKIKAALASNVISLPEVSGGFKVKRSIYTGKAFAITELKSDKKVIAIKKNAYAITEGAGSASVEKFQPSVDEKELGVKVKNIEKATGEVLLPEAEIVVSAGRGLKGPENWGIVEDLAKTLGAATACSKPVSDLNWRPHHEHVGQTGLKVSPNLYIALGISGAIQHLAGVNSSKVIVVINKDAEAPFFKAADYGIVGDVFEVVPKLTEAIKKNK